MGNLDNFAAPLQSARSHAVAAVSAPRRIACALLAAVALSCASLSAQPAAPTLGIDFIDVEGGQATLFIFPNHTSFLVDTGFPGADSRDAKRIAKAARDAGFNKIDYVLFTHYHLDHVGGLSQLVAQIPIGAFIDHGPNSEPNSPPTQQGYAAYQKLLETGKYKHITVKPGDKLPIPGTDIVIVSSNGDVIKKPLPGAGAPNPACNPPAPLPSDVDFTQDQENAHSVGFLMTFGKLRILDLGDLTWDREQTMMCPVNRLGHVNLLVVSHHGSAPSSSPTLVDAIAPQVAVMDNGERKGGLARVLDTVQHSPMHPDLWQLHYAADSGSHNTDPERIANLLSPGGNTPLKPGTLPWDAQPPDAGYSITVQAHPDGTFRVTNTRTGKSKLYSAR